MLSNYFKIAFRSLLKFKGYAAINLLGLALGLTSAMLIMVYVIDELSFDKFHANHGRIYRVGTDVVDIKSGNVNSSLQTNGWPVGALLEKDFPEVEKVVYMANGSNFQINHDGKRFEERIYFAGKDFFTIFTFDMLKGDPATALSKPNNIVITESIEKKYFKGDDAMGKTMIFADTLLFVVSGVVKDVPQQSHIQFGILISFATYETMNSKWFSYGDGWGNLNLRNYILLKEGIDKESFFKKAHELYVTYVKKEMEKWGMYMYVGFEPMNDIYLKTKRGNSIGPQGSIERVYIVSGIAIFVVLLGCINFVNLATARSVYRAKEVGLRKVVGSSRSSLIKQFLSESFMLTMLAFIIAIALIGISLPMFNVLVGKTYSLAVLISPQVIGGVLFLIVLVTFLSGYYPALVMTAMKPTDVLKGSLKTGQQGIQLRRVLVVFQFMISAALIICTFVVIGQLDYMQNRDLGFSGHQVIVLDMDRVTDRGGVGSDGSSSDVFKNELENMTSVESVSFTNAVPGRPGWVGQWAFAEDFSADQSISTEYMAIDEDYLKTLGLTIVAGRNFDLDRKTEIEEGLIINELAAEKFGWGAPENAIGKRVDSPSKHPAGVVIGVVKDYHEFGLQREIFPMAMDYNPSRARYFAVRFKTNGSKDLVASLEKLWKKHYEQYDFKYFFLDENFAKQYQAEQRLATVFTVFSVVTILIATIGLVGLVSFMVVSRTKEIGIRKILGADVLNITRLLSKEFITLVILANAIACPIAWYLADKWLESFAYRMSMDPMLFAWTFVIAILTTVLTVSYQTLKAAMANPVKSLRYE